MRRGKRNMPKFQDFDELIISVPNTKANYKKKYKVVTPVDLGTQVCEKLKLVSICHKKLKKKLLTELP
jgi:hypothetical protein